jgi:hypothetical protein
MESYAAREERRLKAGGSHDWPPHIALAFDAAVG